MRMVLNDGIGDDGTCCAHNGERSEEQYVDD